MKPTISKEHRDRLRRMDTEERGGKALMNCSFGVVNLVSAAFGDGVPLIKAIMRATGRNVTQMAEELECSRTHLSLVLHGHRNIGQGKKMYCWDDLRMREHEIEALIALAKEKVGDKNEKMIRSTALDYRGVLF